MIERDETRERFLAAIAGRLDPGVVAEAHLFPPIRQGGQESGVAVLAVKKTADTEAAMTEGAPYRRLSVYSA